MKTWTVVAAAAALFVCSGDARAQSAQTRMSVGIVVLPSAVRHSVAPATTGSRLPFRSGSYARHREACLGPSGDLVGIGGDRLIVSGQSCSIDSVRTRGQRVEFREVCWRDGREVAIQRRWSRKSVSRFAADGRSYERCRDTVTATR